MQAGDLVKVIHDGTTGLVVRVEGGVVEGRGHGRVVRVEPDSTVRRGEGGGRLHHELGRDPDA